MPNNPIYSDLPQPVINALQEAGGFEFTPDKSAPLKILAAQLPQPPYKIGVALDFLANQSGQHVEVCGVEFDLAAKSAVQNGKKITLTEKEAALITVLYNAKSPLSREGLLQKIWQYAADATTNTVETHIYRLRQKFTENFGSPVIDTVGGNYIIKKNDK